MRPPNVALVGQPNAGKSTLFNVLADAHVASSNFSGTTVEIAESDIHIDGRVVHLIDLPGAYTLNAGDEAEKVTLGQLLGGEIDLVVNVIDVTQLARSLELTVELGELGIPLLVVLNQQDEAERKSLQVRPEPLGAALGVPVLATSARLGKGVKALTTAIAAALREPAGSRPVLPFTAHIESRIQAIERRLGEGGRPGGPHRGIRFLAIKALENPAMLPPGVDPAALQPELDDARREIESQHHRDGFETIAHERHHLAMMLAEQSSRFVARKQIPLAENLDRLLLHPLFGHFFLALFFLLFFGAVFVVGGLLGRWLGAGLELVPPLYAPLLASAPFLGVTLDGIWQGVAGALGIVLPYFLPLLLLSSLFEDTGYLARIAFLLDGLLHRIGLHGKSVAAFVTGLGCTAPAIYQTRILESQRDRLLCALLLPFVPCSARNAVIFALTAALAGPLWALAIYATVLLVVGAAGKGLSLLLPKPIGLIMEIPDLKAPSLRVTLRKTASRLNEFSRQVVPWLLVGSVVMAWLGALSLGRLPDRLLGPLLDHILGLPSQLGGPLVFGFFRKELVAVMTMQALGASTLAALPLSTGQVVVFLVFVTLYFPCLSTFVVLWREFGGRVAAASAALSLLAATLAAAAFRALFLFL